MHSSLKHVTQAHELQVVQHHQQMLRGKDICGRIYISSQGINAQLSGPADDTHMYASWVEQQPEFQVPSAGF